MNELYDKIYKYNELYDDDMSFHQIYISLTNT